MLRANRFKQFKEFIDSGMIQIIDTTSSNDNNNTTMQVSTSILFQLSQDEIVDLAVGYMDCSHVVLKYNVESNATYSIVTIITRRKYAR